jgi:hypothetical protein
LTFVFSFFTGCIFFLVRGVFGGKKIQNPKPTEVPEQHDR